jgi:isoleucyl-tRNA synthetase
VVHLADAPGSFDRLRETVAEELNVKRVEIAGSADVFGRWRARPDFKVLGPRLGPRVRSVAAALEADDGTLAGRLADGAQIEVAGGEGAPVPIGPDDVQLTHDVRSGLGVASEGGVTVALELEITPELRREGLARELVRMIQDARKDAGLQVTDRIALGVETSGEPAAALAAHREEIAAETLATTLATSSVDGFRLEGTLDGTPAVVSLRKEG